MKRKNLKQKQNEKDASKQRANLKREDIANVNSKKERTEH